MRNGEADPTTSTNCEGLTNHDVAVQMDNLGGLLGIRRKDRVPNARIRELCGVKNECYGGSGMWRGWRMIGLPRDSMYECAGSRWIDTVKEHFKEKRFGYQTNKENGPG